MADDTDIQHRIASLIDEEHELRSHRREGEISPQEERKRLEGLEVELDQCWDLLRQRRARREFGQDPDEAQVRPEGVVEGYLGYGRNGLPTLSALTPSPTSRGPPCSAPPASPRSPSDWPRPVP